MSKKHLLLASTLLSVTIMGTQVRAQVTPPPPPEDEVSEVVVTGTRLRLPDYTSPNPVTSVSAETIEARGETNLTDFLLDLPALTGSLDNSFYADTGTASQAGLNLLDLRNLSATRTLVLVNGRRHVAANPGTSSVDVNSIPTDLVKRVDILTGGTSAVYGADGVSGVVNFIMKDDFEGITSRIQYGAAAEGGSGGSTMFGSVLMGKNFLDGRANATLSLEAASTKDLKFDDRDFSRTGQRLSLVNNPNDGTPFPDDPNVPDFILAPDARYIDTSPGGSVITRPFDFTTEGDAEFLGDGSPFIDGIFTSGFIMLGGSGSLTDAYNDDLLPGADRFTANFTGHFDWLPNVRLFSEMKVNRTLTDFEAQPSYDYGLFIPISNPFIPANIVADANAAFLTGDDVVGQLGLPRGVLVARDNFDLGRQSYDLTRDTFRAVFGAKGALSDNADYEVSYVYGQSKQKLQADNVRINERFFAATDVVRVAGVDRCRSDITPAAIPLGDVYAQFPFDPSTFGTTFTPGAGSGCIPINIFGEGHASAAAIDWINTSTVDEATIDQQVVTAFVRGDSAAHFEVPGGGAISYVLGGEYRRESSNYQPDPIAILADTLAYPITNAGRGSVTDGAFEVKEAFAELSIPLLVDSPFGKNLTIGGAYRYSDYSTSGGSDTWNLSASYTPTSIVMFRGTKAKAVRAPNINNLFSGRQQTFAALSDPCDRNNQALGTNPSLRTTQCRAALQALGFTAPQAANFINTSSESIGGFLTGNPLLEPETADTITFGVVITPPFVPGFSFSIDRYDITIKDAITSYSAQTIINNCYDLPQPNQFCTLLSRNGTPGIQFGRIADFQQVPGNIASYKTKGYDITARYNIVPSRFGIERDIGTFDVVLIANMLDNLTTVAASGAAPTEERGLQYVPRWQYSLNVGWDYQAFSVNYAYAFASPTRRIGERTQQLQPDRVEARYFKYEARKEHDLQVRYEIDDRISVYGGVNNLTDQKPEMQDFLYPVSPLGRFLYAGVKITR